MLHLWAVTRGWDRGIEGPQQTRQVWTALSIWGLQQDGWRLDYSAPALGAPWALPQEFPFYHGLVAAAARVSGASIEAAGRAVALALWLLALPAFAWWLTDWGAPQRVRLVALAVMLSGPLLVAQARMVAVDAAALCAGAWFLIGLHRFVATGRFGWWALAAVTGALAAAMQPATFAVCLVPALAWVVAVGAGRVTVRPSGWPRAVGRGTLAAIAPVAAGVGWLIFADRVKAANAFGDELLTGRVLAAQVGPLDERWRAAYWSGALEHAGTTIAGIAMVALAFLGLRWAWRQDRWLLPVALATFAVGMFLFAGGTGAAPAPGFAAAGAFLLLGLGWAAAFAVHEAPLPAAARWMLLAVALGGQAVSLARGYRPAAGDSANAVPTAALALAAVTLPDELVVIAGRGADPALAWWAKRRALTLPSGRETEQPALDRALDALAADGRTVGAMLLTGRLRENPELVSIVANRFGFATEPVAEFDGNALHVRAGASAAAREALRIGPAGPRLGLRTEPPPPDAPRPELPPTVTTFEPDPEIFGLLHPLPVAATVAYGFGNFEVEGARGVSVHAPSELEFHLPEGARRLEAEFLLSPGAYTEGGNSDGVEFEIELVNPGEKPRVLFRRFLNPLRVPVDRGTHRVALDIDARPGATVFARTLPGPRGDSSYDWAFWRRIDIR